MFHSAIVCGDSSAAVVDSRGADGVRVRVGYMLSVLFDELGL